MSNPDAQADTPAATMIGEHLCVSVPWDSADELQARLRREGVETTLHLEPESREARLELWQNADVAKVQALLAG
jgi:hypothetical protein